MKKLNKTHMLLLAASITAVSSLYYIYSAKPQNNLASVTPPQNIQDNTKTTQINKERQHQIQELQDQVFELTARLNVLSNKQLDLQEDLSQVNSDESKAHLPDASTDQLSDTDHLTPEEREAEQDRKLRAQLDFLEQTHNVEQTDAQWSSWAENEILTKFQTQPLKGTQVTSTECKANTCRMEFAFNDIETRDQAMGDIPNMVPWDSQGFFHADEADPLKMVVYVSREGQQLSRYK